MLQFQINNVEIAQSLLKKFIYFDIFSHPLSEDEAIHYCDYPNLETKKGITVLRELEAKNLLNYQSGFYYLGPDSSKIKTRLEGNRLAGVRMKTAEKYTKIISYFPFVRGIFISGSLSKNVMKPESDIDFFIIVQPGRLWVCRALLTIFKKVFLANSFRNFCLNYFITTQSLEIPDKNLFTATEIAFMLPMYNYALYLEFLEANKWYKTFFPNKKIQQEKYKTGTAPLTKFLEKPLNNKFGDWFEKKSFSVIAGFWKKKYRHLSAKSFSLNMRSLNNISKHHPNAWQQHVLTRYEEGMRSFELSSGYYLKDHTKREKMEQ